jgi:hypothetical protein
VTIGSYIIIVAGYRRIYNGFTVHYMVNIIIYSVIIQSMAQKLSPTARRAKAARDLAYAMTPDRRRKKADSQKIEVMMEREQRKNPVKTIKYNITWQELKHTLLILQYHH